MSERHEVANKSSAANSVKRSVVGLFPPLSLGVLGI